MRRMQRWGLVAAGCLAAGCATTSGATGVGMLPVKGSAGPVMSIVAASKSYYDQQGRWPRTLDQLQQFARQQQLALDMHRIKSIQFVPLPNGKLRIEYEPALAPNQKPYTGTVDLSAPSKP